MNTLKTLLFIIILMQLGACKTSKNGNQTDFSKMIEEQIGSEYESLKEGSYTLYFTISAPGEARKKIIVVDHEQKEILYGPKAVNADVSWHSATEILLVEFPEVIPDKNAVGSTQTLLNVITGEKKKINQLNKLK